MLPSSYYAWQQCPATGAVERAEPAWETAFVTVFDHQKRRYGTRRLQVELPELGRQALRTELRRHGRRALQPRAFAQSTTDSTHGQRCAPHLLFDQPRPTQANRVWVSDITYLPLPMAHGPTYAHSRTGTPSTSWAGTWGPRCRKN